MSGPRMTIPTQLVLSVFLAEPERELYGYELSEEVGLATGTIHPILARLEGAGWLRSYWEDVQPFKAGRPARRYYAITPLGVDAATAALRKAARGRPGVPRPLPGLP